MTNINQKKYWLVPFVDLICIGNHMSASATNDLHTRDV